jgi:hypothetical protein
MKKCKECDGTGKCDYHGHWWKCKKCNGTGAERKDPQCPTCKKLKVENEDLKDCLLTRDNYIQELKAELAKADVQVMKNGGGLKELPTIEDMIPEPSPEPKLSDKMHKEFLAVMRDEPSPVEYCDCDEPLPSQNKFTPKDECNYCHKKIYPSQILLNSKLVHLPQKLSDLVMYFHQLYDIFLLTFSSPKN